jgi:indole-3-glycerol phosphate synthase
MNILDTIVLRKKEEVADAKYRISTSQLEKTDFYKRENISLKQRLLTPGSTGIIAEFKRRSPSKGLLNGTANPVQVVKGYEKAGVAGSSVLTDIDFFQGAPDDLRNVRAEVSIPLLRKDFMIDDYQFVEAKSWGADVVLLIASILTPTQVRDFTRTAHNLGLEVLLELHGENEMEHVHPEVDMVGINNRNLKTFEVDVEQSLRMAEQLGLNIVKVAESGIVSPKTITYFRDAGFNGFLIGETFMKTADPASACQQFISEI